LQILLIEKDEHRVFDNLLDIARNLGFDHCAYGMRSPLPLSRQRIVTAEISVIMGLSVRTVTFHIGNVVKKLNASNKTAAAVRAAVLGML
jgi:hypothetical protein